MHNSLRTYTHSGLPLIVGYICGNWQAGFSLVCVCVCVSMCLFVCPATSSKLSGLLWLYWRLWISIFESWSNIVTILIQYWPPVLPFIVVMLPFIVFPWLMTRCYEEILGNRMAAAMMQLFQINLVELRSNCTDWKCERSFACRVAGWVLVEAQCCSNRMACH